MRTVEVVFVMSNKQCSNFHKSKRNDERRDKYNIHAIDN